MFLFVTGIHFDVEKKEISERLRRKLKVIILRFKFAIERLAKNRVFVVFYNNPLHYDRSQITIIDFEMIFVWIMKIDKFQLCQSPILWRLGWWCFHAKFWVLSRIWRLFREFKWFSMFKLFFCKQVSPNWAKTKNYNTFSPDNVSNVIEKKFRRLISQKVPINSFFPESLKTFNYSINV